LHRGSLKCTDIISNRCHQGNAGCDEIRAVNATREPGKSAGRAAGGKAGRGGEADAGGQPRYLQIARALKRGIAEGRWPVGAQLPTELVLCEQFGISRFTARAAVRVLATAGLITRRQRVGTIVIATPDAARYSQDAAALPDLLQYAQDTELRLLYVGRIALSRSQARDFGAEAGVEWIYAVGIRHETANGKGRRNGRPLCLTRLFLNPVLKGIESKLRERKSAVYALIERDFGIPIERVDQDLQGVVLDADDAANLGAKPGAPALRIVRRYFSDDGRLLEVADNLHPSDRFTYHMQLRK
jgi:DNA-binding GntR family transcriptional regulator